MKIYTKGGDTGETSLLGGKRVKKSDTRIEAYGTVDELIAFTGLLRDREVAPVIKNTLIRIQDRLMVCASILAADCDDCQTRIPALDEEDVIFLEQEIDRMSEIIPPIRSFILPGGNETVSLCHVVRTICRRAERRIIALEEQGTVPELVISYINRLSDYFFILSRFLSFEFQADEIKWPSKVD
ncbi:MAG: cob(I)yrinic acid a,c-diamide adenosyltransferase [Bacteroidales bacterium]|nr:cob(I)yrinic acid a,c-diamide adenosyltransferase [Bacteroidales bacterium]